jgi:hypothetical protein
MVAVLALVGEPLLQSSGQMLSATTVRLPKAVCGLPPLVRMRNLFPSGARQQGREAGVNADRPIRPMRNVLGLCVDEQTQRPARGTLDNAATFDASRRDVLRMHAEMSYPWNVEARPLWVFERIRKRDARQPVAPPFALGLLGQLLIASLPGCLGRIQQSLQRMAGHPELWAVVCQEIGEGFGRVGDTIVPILRDLADSPIPDPCELEPPGLELVCL